MPARDAAGAPARIPYAGYHHLLKRRFEEAIDIFLAAAGRTGAERGASPAHWRRPTAASASRRWPTRCAAACAPCAATSGCSARAIRRIIRCACAPNCCGRRADLFPILREATPVRMDLTHSGWSDIFFLGMDYPEGARVLNISVDLAVRGASAAEPKPPVEAYLRVIDRAGAAPGQRRSAGHRGDRLSRRSVRFRARLPGAAEGRGDRLRDSCRRAWRAPAEPLADVLARSHRRPRATASRSSAR